MARRRYFSNSATPTTLTQAAAAADTSIQVASVVGHPDRFPYTLTLSKNDSALAEAIEVTAATGTVLTVVRGIDGTIARNHPPGNLVSHDHTARDYDDVQESVGYRRLFLLGG